MNTTRKYIIIAMCLIIVVTCAVLLYLDQTCYQYEKTEKANDTSSTASVTVNKATLVWFPEYLGTIAAEPSVFGEFSRSQISIIVREPSGRLTREDYSYSDGIIYLTPNTTLAAGSDLWRAALRWPGVLTLNPDSSLLTIFGNDRLAAENALSTFSCCTWTQVQEMLNDTKAPPE